MCFRYFIVPYLYCVFDSARFIFQKKAEVSKRQYSSKAKGSNVRDFLAAENTVLNSILEWAYFSTCT